MKGRRRPVVIGLTGSIAMGKSVAAGMFRDLGVPVFDADRAVHDLLGRGGDAVSAVERAFPGTVVDGVVDRGRLGRRVFGDPHALSRLERVLHPRVRGAENRFLREVRRRRAAVAVLDIPLLFETGGDRRCDLTVVVSAPAFLQRQRAMRRPGMDDDRLRAVLARQMPDNEKRRRADHVVPTGLGRGFTRRRIAAIIARAASGNGGGCRCGRSSSIPRRRVWTRRRATGSSRSDASSS